MIPSCQLNAMFGLFEAPSESTKKVPPLRYCVKLLGAKKPYDMFTIILSTTTTINNDIEKKGTLTSC